MVTKLETYSDFRWWLADWNIIFVDFWWFGLFALVSCYTFSVVENWSVSWTSTARLKYCDGIIVMSGWRHDDVIRGWERSLPDRDCTFPSIQFHRHQGTCNPQHRNLENRKFLGKGISLLSSLSAHNLEKSFKNVIIKRMNFKVQFFCHISSLQNRRAKRVWKQAIYNKLNWKYHCVSQTEWFS